MTIHADVKLDAKGLACPMPIVKTKKTIEKEVQEGQVVEIQATDQGSKADLVAWAKSTGHQYIGLIEEGDVLFHYIRKCNPEKADATEKTFTQTASNDDLANATGIILDVREAAEYAFGHIPGALSMPLGELEERMNELNKNEAIYVICRTGTRSDLAAQTLAANGFTNVYNVLPGMSEWQGETAQEL